MNIYKRHRFPSNIFSYAVWLYHRFNLSHRDIEDLLAERGIIVSYETIRLWGTDKLTPGRRQWRDEELNQSVQTLPISSRYYPEHRLNS